MEFTKCLVVQAKQKLKNGFTTAAKGSIGYVRPGNYYYASYNNNKLYIISALFPKTRGNLFAEIGLNNDPAEATVRIIEEIEEMPKFAYLGKYRYKKVS